MSPNSSVQTLNKQWRRNVLLQKPRRTVTG